MSENYDVAVVGGGAAGLNGALALARSRRSVLVVDAGDPRPRSFGRTPADPLIRTLNCLREPEFTTTA